MSMQFILKEVLNVGVYDFASYATTPTPMFYIDYAEVTNHEQKAQRIMITGGQGNYLLGVSDHSKTSNIKLSLPLSDLNLLSYLTGDTLTTAAQNIFQRDVLTVSGGSATLSKTPVSTTAANISVYYLGGTRDNTGVALGQVASAPTAGQYSITGSTLTLNSADNNRQIVVWYMYSAPSTTTKFSFKANKFPKSVKLFGTGVAHDQVAEEDIGVSFVFHKARPKSDFNISLSATAATKLELDFDLMPIQVGTDYVFADYNILT